jgi:hypothetical protein
MKISHTYHASWFLFAAFALVVVGELLAWIVSEQFGLINRPVTVALLCGALAAVLVDSWCNDSRDV